MQFQQAVDFLNGHLAFEDINTRQFKVAQKTFFQTFLKTTGKEVQF